MTSPPDVDALWRQAELCHRRGDAEGALLALHRALLLRRDGFQAQQQLCRLLYETPGAFATSAPAPPPDRPALVSVVMCSVDPAKFAAARDSYARAFGDAAWELVGIHDARSLAEGYTRGLARSRGDVVVFSHDDLAILGDDLAGELARALEGLDVVGVAGAARLCGPAFAWGGNAVTRGRIAEPAGDGVQLVLFNPAPGLTRTEAIDGVFMAARRETARAVGFDAATYDGFHLYDMDFSYRAHRAGLRVGITSGIVLRHDSAGGFDAAWEAYADRFLARHPEVRAGRVQSYLTRIPFPDAGRLVGYCRRLDELGRRAMAAP